MERRKVHRQRPNGTEFWFTRVLRRICCGCVGFGVLVSGWVFGLWVLKVKGEAAVGAGDSIQFCQGAERQGLDTQ